MSSFFITKSRVRNILNYKRPVFWVGLLAVVVVVVLAISLLGNPVSNKESSGDEGRNLVQSLAGYIIMDENTLYIDEVEVITTEHVDRMIGLNLHDPDRIAELDLNVGDMPNGYYIHNPGKETIAFELTDETTYTFTDVRLLFVEDADGNRLYTTANKEDFIQHLNTLYSDSPPAGTVPFFIDVHDGKVISMTEKFIFTQ